VSTTGLLGQVRARRRALDRAQQVYGERLAPEFGVFQFVDTSEEGISRVLAWLLDVRADHTQGDRFLRTFLCWLNVEWPEEAIEHARVQVEAPVTTANSTRFIDILISGRTHALAIENKLLAPDQPAQVADYMRFLRNGFGTRHCLLYLTPDGRSPSAASIAAAPAGAARSAGCLHERSYEALIEFLNECLQQSRAQKVSFFIEDLIQHIGQSVVGVENMQDTAQLASEIADDSKSLSAALEIFEAEGEVKSILMRRAQEKIDERCKAEGWSIQGDISAGKKHDYITLLFSPEDTWGFGLAFYQAGYRSMFYGLARKEGADARRRPKLELIAALNGVQKGRGDTEWPWWVKPHLHNHFFPYPREWAGTREFWLAVHEGEFVERLISFASAMRLHLKKAKMLGHLS
jgi:hypothetical protein